MIKDIVFFVSGVFGGSNVFSLLSCYCWVVIILYEIYGINVYI